MTNTVKFTVVAATDGLVLVKTIFETDTIGNSNVKSSSSARLFLASGESLPKNILANSFQFVVLGSILIVSSQTTNESDFFRFFSWKILVPPTSLEPIKSEDILFLNEFGQIVKNNLTGLCFDTRKITIAKNDSSVLLQASRTRILVGGIAKTETKSFSLQFETKVNKKGKQVLGNFQINRLKTKKVE
jgi:hypothetical protein